MSRLKLGMLFLLLISGMIFISIVNGNSVTLNQTNSSQLYYITIDPIGTFKSGDVLFINGTTNLSQTDFLTGSIYQDSHHTEVDGTGQFHGAALSNISIVNGISSNTNRWSVNVTNIVINDLPSEYSPYFVVIYLYNSSLGTSQVFNVLPRNAATTNQTTIPQSPVSTVTGLSLGSSTTQSSPLPVILPIFSIVVILIFTLVYFRRDE